MSMIKRLFGGARPSEPEASAPAEPPGSDKTSDSRTFQVDNAQAGTRRELVRVMTRDTLRASGIPDGWIETQLLLELGDPPDLELVLVLGPAAATRQTHQAQRRRHGSGDGRKGALHVDLRGRF